jgi:hypothetical protein
MSWRRQTFTSLLILLLVFILQWLLLFTLKEPTWDAVSYYAYARSAVFDGDLDFANDFRLSYPTAGEHFASKQLDQVTTAAGRVQNLFAVGAPILWAPLLAVLRLTASLNLAPSIDSRIMTGYETFFVGNIAMFSALIGFIAYYLSYRLAKAHTTNPVALAATITLMFATPLLYYQFREPLYSHTASAMMVALVVVIWWHQLEGERFTPLQGLVLGAVIGFAGLARWQNLAYLALPVISIIFWWYYASPRRLQETIRRTLPYLLLVGLGTFSIFAVQMSVWQTLYGSFVTLPQGNSFMVWTAPFLEPFLFSSFRGVLAWMPLFFLSVIGLLALARRAPQFALPLLIMLVLTVYINGSTRDWFAGGGFGPRRLTSELAILAVGYAAFLQALPRDVRGWIAAVLGFLLAVHQWLLLRFALEESLGGRVVSMLPTFEWQDQPLALFYADMARLAQDAINDPLRALLFSGSPLEQLLTYNVVPWSHLTVFLISALFLIALIGGSLILWHRKHTAFAYSAAVLTIILLVAVQVWILYWA